MSVTLDDVARVAGVARSTASRALNGDRNVKEDTRQRVLAVAQSLGFRFNHAARSLAQGWSDVLGLIVPAGSFVADPYHTLLVSSVVQVANEQRKGVMLWMAGLDVGSDGFERVLAASMVDGVLVASRAIGVDWVDELLERPYPLVILGSDQENQADYSVEADNELGGRLMAEHLAELGHRRIAVITGPLHRSDSQTRFDSFVASLKEAGIAIDDAMVREGDYHYESGRRSMTELLPSKPTAVFVGNDQMAFGAIDALEIAGVSVPNEVSIISFDDVPAAQTAKPPLTTVKLNAMEMARLAIDLVDEAIAPTPDGVKRQRTPVELVVRSSTGPPATPSS